MWCCMIQKNIRIPPRAHVEAVQRLRCLLRTKAGENVDCLRELLMSGVLRTRSKESRPSQREGAGP